MINIFSFYNNFIFTPFALKEVRSTNLKGAIIQDQNIQNFITTDPSSSPSPKLGLPSGRTENNDAIDNASLISIILPIFNEEKNIPLMYQQVCAVLQELPAYTFELILVNDGSTDNSWHIIKQLAQHDDRIKAISFSRNFGHQIALKAGYDMASGDAIITMDADLQHPPQIIEQLLAQWRTGYDIVYVRRLRRDDNLFKKIFTIVYYRFFDLISDVPIPRHVGDFRLVDKKVLAVLKQHKEQRPYWRGLVAWTGFKHTYVDCHYGQRTHGTSSYTWKKMFQLAFDGMTGFSLFPLKLAAYVGIFVIASGSAMFAYITYDALLHDVYYPLFKWLVTIIYIFMGVQFLLLWLLGQYIGRMYEQQRERPPYIVVEKIDKVDPSIHRPQGGTRGERIRIPDDC